MIVCGVICANTAILQLRLEYSSTWIHACLVDIDVIRIHLSSSDVESLQHMMPGCTVSCAFTTHPVALAFFRAQVRPGRAANALCKARLRFRVEILRIMSSVAQCIHFGAEGLLEACHMWSVACISFMCTHALHAHKPSAASHKRGSRCSKLENVDLKLYGAPDCLQYAMQDCRIRMLLLLYLPINLPMLRQASISFLVET